MATCFPREGPRAGSGHGPCPCPLMAVLLTARPGGAGNIKTLGDAYEFAVDVRDFSPEDIIVTTSNNHIEVRAEKVSLASPLPTLRTPCLVQPSVSPAPTSPCQRPLPAPTRPGQAGDLGPAAVGGSPPSESCQLSGLGERERRRAVQAEGPEGVSHENVTGDRWQQWREDAVVAAEGEVFPLPHLHPSSLGPAARPHLGTPSWARCRTEALQFRVTHSRPHSPSPTGLRVTGSLGSLSLSSQETLGPLPQRKAWPGMQGSSPRPLGPVACQRSAPASGSPKASSWVHRELVPRTPATSAEEQGQGQHVPA